MFTSVQKPAFIHFYLMRFLNVALDDVRYYLLLTGIFIYACFGSPTPDVIGWVEILVGALLFFSLPWLEAVKNFHGFKFLAIIIFSIGMGGAVLAGAHETLILRDVVAFVFLFLPLLMLPIFQDKPQRVKSLLFMFILCGAIFAFRSLSLMGDLNFWLGAGDHLYYLSNSPAVLCAAIFSALLLCRGMMDWRRVNLLSAIFLFIICALSLAAMGAMLQRASLALLVISLAFYLAVQFKNKPYRALPAVFVIALLSGFIAYGFHIVIEAMSFKSRVVGDNMRIQEWGAVWGAVSGNPFTIIFGLGFGGTFESPAVGGMDVNYTHGLLGSVLLKTGLAGLLLTCVYLWMLAKKLGQILRRDLIIGLSLLAPFIIDVFLYASFKSFEFGVLLTLIMTISLKFKETKGFQSLIFRAKYN